MLEDRKDKQTCHVLQIDKWIVNMNDLNSVLFQGSPQDESSNSTESVNSY